MTVTESLGSSVAVGGNRLCAIDVPLGTPPERVAAAMVAVAELLTEEAKTDAAAGASGTWRDKGPWVRAALLEAVSGGDLRWRPGPWV
ncbi:MAG: hypothetical protein VKO64_05730 [Candidatus Sericytochromatia bacterium]|nr:hypothetical protein [Candidatus Sericytochromatia bacterium]